MDSEKLEKMVKSFHQRFSNISDKTVKLRVWPARHARLLNLLAISEKLFPDHTTFFEKISENIGAFDIYDVDDTVEYILEIVEIEESSKVKIESMKIFESAEEKVKQAGLSFRNDDYPSTLNNLNTALELVLKNKLAIPTTITKINTSNIIDILVKHKVDPYPYLAEAKKRIVMIDNKIKHQGYSPSKIDCINSMKVMEELISKLRGKEIKLTGDIRNKIYLGL